jgi:hypothetical protein
MIDEGEALLLTALELESSAAERAFIIRRVGQLTAELNRD